MLFLMMAALPEGDGPREYLPEEAGNVLDRGEARGLHLLEIVREAVGLSRGREPRPDVRLQLRTAKSKCQTEKTQGSITAVLSVASSDSAPGGDPSDRSDPDDPSRKG